MIYGQGRRALMRAAEEALAEHGVDGVTTRDLCVRAGVRAPALYHHFGSKDGLLEQVLQEVYQRYRETKREVPVTGDPATDLRRGWDAHVEFARSNPATYPLMLRPGSAAAAESLASLRSGFERINEAGALRTGINPELATTVLANALRGTAARSCVVPENPVTARASSILRDAVIASLLREHE